MIRDPSDGSIREKPVTKLPENPALTEKHQMVSGLRESNHKAEYLERLNKSREWLKKYMQRYAE